MNPCGRKWLRAFQRAKISPQDMQLNAISCIFLPKFKLNAVKSGLSGHKKRTDDRLMHVKCVAEGSFCKTFDFH